MPKSVALAFGNDSYAVAGRPLHFVATVTNSDAAAVLLSSLVVSEDSRMGAVIEQPNSRLAGQPWDSSSPTLNGASATLSYGFSVAVPSPNMPGPSPSTPGGAAGQVAPPTNSQLVLRATGHTSDGSVFSSSFAVPVLSAVAPFPLSEGGAAQFRQGGNANLIAVLQ